MFSDTAVLVPSEIQHVLVNSSEDIALDVSMCSLQGLKIGVGSDSPYERNYIGSQSDCCTSVSSLSGITTTQSGSDSLSDTTPMHAGCLDHKYRYHLFIAYHRSDVEWVRLFVTRLEKVPFSYKCCYAERDFDSSVSEVQNTLCSIVLSQRIVVVLDRKFVEESWSDYEESIAHISSFTDGPHRKRQRVIPILREECTVPDSLRMLPSVDARQEDYWEEFIQTLCLGKLV